MVMQINLVFVKDYEWEDTSQYNMGQVFSEVEFGSNMHGFLQ
jgi:hypothetical protein